MLALHIQNNSFTTIAKDILLLSISPANIVGVINLHDLTFNDSMILQANGNVFGTVSQQQLWKGTLQYAY